MLCIRERRIMYGRSGRESAEAPCRKAHHDININHYATKKTAAQSILHVALLMANSSQLKTLLYVIVGLRPYNLNDRRKHTKLNKMNNVVLFS
uniref:Uncharacterized protein n=1 Tax=Mola mola TaxID=94237 RepID=A0A3Q4BPR2_MOLML